MRNREFTPTSHDGLYAPGSITWRVASDNALMLGGGRALLMQLAHPLVAAGVAAHSDFLEQPVRRLERTMKLTLGMVFGTRAEALASARAVNQAHERVTGRLGESVPGFPAGAPYRAFDPDLLLWVHSTLVDSALETYTTFVGPLTAAERDAYWRESWAIGRLLGQPDRAFPPTYPDFAEYVDRVVSTQLQVTEEARRLARAVLRPPLRGVPRGMFWPHEVITAGLLPARLRAQYRLPWGFQRRTAYRGLVISFRGVVKAAPTWVRRAAPARAAEQRLARPS
ncbi:MAG TPA: oxygenase MpaB family protein [Candidatus Dormibacteraeota bacterium]